MSEATVSTFNIFYATGCPVHGSRLKRAVCATCNAAYMRAYLRNRRQNDPLSEILHRARKRARKHDVPFSLAIQDIIIPTTCPVLGIPLVVGASRSDNSPSLDRIDPTGGYIRGNVRVISDRANRLKGSNSLHKLQDLALHGLPIRRADFSKIARYVEREMLLVEVRRRAVEGGKSAAEWAKVAKFLERAFAGEALTYR